MNKNLSCIWISVALFAVGCGGKVSGSDEPAPVASAPASTVGSGATPPASIPVYGTVHIVNRDADRPSCTGVFLRDDVVVTARHCVNEISDDGTGQCKFGSLSPTDSFSLRFETGDGSIGIGRVNAIDVEETTSCLSDIAVLHVFGSSPVSRKPMLSSAVPSPGDLLYIDQKPAVTRTAAIEPTFLELDSPVCLGDAGKAIIDSKGQLAGIVSNGPIDKRTPCASTLYALPVAPHLALLRRALGG